MFYVYYVGDGLNAGVMDALVSRVIGASTIAAGGVAFVDWRLHGRRRISIQRSTGLSRLQEAQPYSRWRCLLTRLGCRRFVRVPSRDLLARGRCQRPHDRRSKTAGTSFQIRASDGGQAASAAACDMDQDLISKTVADHEFAQMKLDGRGRFRLRWVCRTITIRKYPGAVVHHASHRSGDGSPDSRACNFSCGISIKRAGAPWSRKGQVFKVSRQRTRSQYGSAAGRHIMR